MKTGYCSITATRFWTRFVRRIAVFAASVLILGNVQSHADVLSWSGGAVTDGNWSRIENWGSAGVPASGDTLIFSASQPNQLTTNDIPGLILNQIKFVGAGGGYTNRGLGFTITNNIVATNTIGTNAIESDITLATMDQIVDVKNALTLSGILSGSVGLTKNGTGKLLLNGNQSNTYGTTRVNAGVVLLAKVGGFRLAIPGDLIVGSAASSATVQYLDCCEIADTANITITNNSTLDFNGNDDIVGANIILYGFITTGTGTCTLLPNSFITVPPGGGQISGNLNISSGTCTIQADGALGISASISGSADIVKNGSGSVHLSGANTFTGSFTANGDNYVWVTSPLGLGATNGGTFLNGNTWLALSGNLTVSNEALAINSPYPGGTLYVYATDTNTWTGPVVLNTNISVQAFTNCGLVLSGGISGPGSIVKNDDGLLTLSGSTANTYGGTTTVNGGTLTLNKTAFDGAVPHDLIINSNSIVQCLRGDQIANAASVTSGPAGTLSLAGNLAVHTVLPSPVHTTALTGNWTLGYAFTPTTNITVTHVRHYFGTKVSIWTDAGTLLATQNVVSVPGTWVETPLSTPIQLTAGSTYRVAAYTAGGTYYFRNDLGTNFPNGTIVQSYEIGGDAFPISTDAVRWWFVDFRYTTGSGGDSISSLNGGGVVNLGSGSITSLGSGTHNYDGVISGNGSFNVAGSALNYTLNGNNTYSGQTLLMDGTSSTLMVNGFQPQSPVYVGTLDTLGGSGTVGNITSYGIVAPGSSPGILSSGNVVINPAPARYSVELTGPTAGADYDQLNVLGTCFITNANLSINLAFSKPVALGQQFVIINNDGVDPVKGHFIGYNEGDSWQQSGYTAVISYAGGDGNDVTLTLTTIPGDTAGSFVTSGNGDGVIAPNECNNFSVIVTNKTATPMTGVTATLSSTTPGVIVIESAVPYPNIAGNGKGTNPVPFQISTTPNFICGSNISLTLSVTSASHGAFSVPITLATGTPSASPVRFDNNTTIGLSDISTNESTNVVSTWTGGPLSKVAVSLWLSAPLDSDLSLTLIAPNGASVDLSSGNGGGANFGSGSADGNRTTFDDAAVTSITTGSPPFVGTFKPEAPLSALIGTTPVVGNWRLRVADPFFFGAGDTLRNWSLFLYGTDCGTGSGLCELCPNVTLTSALGPNSLTQTTYVAISGPPSVCGVAKACPGTLPLPLLPSEVFTFHNGPTDACITITVTNISVGGGVVVSAHSAGFDPGNPDKCTNYLGDLGGAPNPGGQGSFSISVTSNATFVINVIGASYGNYKLSVTGGDCRPALNVTDIGGGKAKLDWTTAAAGYQLESTNILGSGSPVWPMITNTPAVVNSRYQVTNTVPAADQFYHLRKPVP